MVEIPPVAPEGGGNGPEVPGSVAASPLVLVSSSGSRMPCSAAGPVAWELRQGLAPFVGYFVVSRNRGEEWLTSADGGFCSLEWSRDGAARVFQKLRVLRASQDDPFHVTIHVADRRSRWRYARFFGRANLRRRVNDRTAETRLAETAGTGEGQSPERTGIVIGSDARRDDLSTMAEERYRQWTVKEDGTPYTARELLRVALFALHEEIGEDDALAALEESLGSTPDNGEVVDAAEYLGEPYLSVFEFLLRRAEVGLTVDADGLVRLIDPYRLPDLPAVHIKGGALRVPSLARIRPAVIEVYATAERDKRGIFRVPAVDAVSDVAGEGSESPKGNKATDKPDNTFRLQNVLQLRLPELIGATVAAGTGIAVGGTMRDAGEWVLVYEALAAWGITDQDVREGFMFGGDGLLKKFARRVVGGRVFNDPVWAARIQSILEHYRQTFRIEPKYRDTLRSWQPLTVTVVSTRTRQRQKSPVYMEWCNLFPALLVDRRRGPPDKSGENLSSWRVRDANGNEVDADVPQTAPARLAPVDEDNGIFRIELHRSVDGGVAERVPCHLERIPQPFDTGVRQRLQFFTKDTFLADHFRLEVVISVIEGTPNFSEGAPLAGKESYFVQAFRNETGGDGGAHVPKLQLMIREDTARFNEHGELANKDQIVALAKAEALAAANSYLDRALGVLTVRHDPTDAWRVGGHITSIQFRRDPDGRESVVVNAGEPPPEMLPIRFAPPAVRNFLFKLLPTAGGGGD